ncbi:lasso peptide biosynthesis B2 protein [Magnetospirillum molischianum]|uniref:Microcin J25-processing protein McjB C-terminal domain-containing protein n=1 Tax=Magnetospirillum molischianum DSM 120 TaxID=1150626 RepID=H8FWE6_MAGML|nr:lasso peptide biosynthesis B2 protein [Magnetospirillum molischianum]CCG42684.1 conserved hypothetical protein [Magnetospirillum molischianum DSM 120]
MSAPVRRASDWLRAGEAVCMLIAARLALSVLPVRVVFRSLCLTISPVGEVRLDEKAVSSARQVGLAVERAARRLPIETRCLHSAVAGALMLRRRRLQATVVLGVRSNDGLKAHAWLLCAGALVLGGAQARSFVPLAAFSSGTEKG